MKLFESRAELKATIEKLTTDLTTKDTVVSELTSKITALEAQLTNTISADILSKVQADNTELESRLVLMSSELATTKAEVTNFKIKVDETAAIKAMEIVAGQSSPPISLTKNTEKTDSRYAVINR